MSSKPIDGSVHELPPDNSNDTVISKYTELVGAINEIRQDVKRAYVGNKTSLDRLKKTISSARAIVSDCLKEADKFKHFKMTSENWKKIYELDTILNADSIEWCPIKPYQLHFVCGTYFLMEKNDNQPYVNQLVQERKGALLLLRVNEKTLDNMHCIEMWGLLDIKWCNRSINSNIVLATVNAIGELSVFRLNEGKMELLCKINTKSDEEGDYMALAVKWDNTNHTESAQLCATDNKGSAVILKLENNDLILLEKWKAHSLEAWTISFDVANTCVIYTGGDDGKLSVWDIRESITKRIDSKRQNSGVTIIETNTNQSNQVLSGSFDEIIFLWDNRQWKAPVEEFKTSGGPWRAKFSNRYLLTANIYGGFQIFDCSGSPVEKGCYKEHESLAYGADWCLLSSSEVSKMFHCDAPALLLGTCSFYDHKLTVSLWKPDC